MIIKYKMKDGVSITRCPYDLTENNPGVTVAGRYCIRCEYCNGILIEETGISCSHPGKKDMEGFLSELDDLLLKYQASIFTDIGVDGGGYIELAIGNDFNGEMVYEDKEFGKLIEGGDLI